MDRNASEATTLAKAHLDVTIRRVTDGACSVRLLDDRR
jgi:hypothetical protein